MPTGTTAGTPLQWETLSLSDLIPSELQDVIDAINDVIAVLESVITLLIEAVKIAKLFLIGLDDIFAAVYQVLLELVQSMVQQLTQTGIYNLVHYTPSFSAYMTPDQWLSQVGHSLDDKMDAERPILVDEYAYVGAVVLMTTSDNLKDLLLSWKQLCAMLGSFVGSLFTQVGNWPNPGDPFEVIEGVGQVPNWQSIKLGDIIPGLSQAADYLMKMLDSLKPASGQSDLLDALLAALQNKIAVMEGYGNKILGVLAMISAILSIEGIYMLKVMGQGESSWFKNRLSTATGGPHDYGKYDSNGNEIPSEDRKEATFTLGTVFLVTGGSTAAVEFILNFFDGVVLPPPNPDIPALPDVP